MMHHYGKMILVLTSFLNEKGYNFKMSNYGVCFFLLCTVNYVPVLKKDPDYLYCVFVKLIFCFLIIL